MREVIVKISGYIDDIPSFKRGWGCGYVYIPKEHPILVNLYSQEFINYSYLQPENCEEEITFSMWDSSMDYYIIGFDTSHYYNDSSHDEEYVMNQTIKIKEIVDSYTFEDGFNDAINIIKKLKDENRER